MFWASEVQRRLTISLDIIAHDLLLLTSFHISLPAGMQPVAFRAIRRGALYFNENTLVIFLELRVVKERLAPLSFFAQLHIL